MNGRPWARARDLGAGAVLPVSAAVLGVGLKAWYAAADLDGLRWLLAPTTWLVSRLSGVSFELDAHQGYLSRTARFEIVPACAGVNFLITVLLTLSITAALAGWRGWKGLAALPLAALAATLVTIVANAVRLAIAVRLHAAAVTVGPLAGDRLHHVQGTLVFFTFLLVTQSLAARVLQRARDA